MWKRMARASGPVSACRAARPAFAVRSAALSALVVLGAALTLAARPGQAQVVLPEILEAVKFRQRLDSQVPRDLVFRDHRGAQVRLGDYFGTQPVLLHLAYYRCPMLCNMTREGMSDSNREFWLKYCPVGRLGELPEIAGLVLFLASREAAYVNGETISVTGGLDWAP